MLTATAESGRFASVPSAVSIFLSLLTGYTATSVDLTLNRIPFGAVPGLSGNQRAVGDALEVGYSTSLTGLPARFYGKLISHPRAMG